MGYELSYEDANYKVVTLFDSDISSTELRQNLKYFLLACSWLPSQVKQIIKEDE